MVVSLCGLFRWTRRIIFLFMKSSWCKCTNYYNVNWVEIWFVVSISVHSISEFNKWNFFRFFLCSKWNEWLYTLAVRNFHFSAWYSREFIRSPRAFWPLKTSKLRDSVKEDLLMLFSRSWKWAVIIRACKMACTKFVPSLLS